MTVERLGSEEFNESASSEGADGWTTHVGDSRGQPEKFATLTHAFLWDIRCQLDDGRADKIKSMRIYGKMQSFPSI